MTAEQMFEQYKTEHPEAETYEAWAFCGGGPVGDELAALVLAGTKTGTASVAELYAFDGDPYPEPGALSVVLYDSGEAACIIETTAAEVVPFDQVSEAHAFAEGEGSRTLAEWREVHERVFRKELDEEIPEAGLTFSHDMPVLCERFRLVYPKRAGDPA